MLLLLDQDGVLADFDGGFVDAWTASGHPFPALATSDRKSFYLRDDYPVELHAEMERVYTAPGFIRNLAPLPGAIDAVGQLLALGNDVRICTSPLNKYKNCVTEKFEWVEQHLGADFVHRLIVTKDKTLVHGDVLVDDKPLVTGTRTPNWRQIIFDQPYNRTATGLRMSWDNWRDVLAGIA